MSESPGWLSGVEENAYWLKAGCLLGLGFGAHRRIKQSSDPQRVHNRRNASISIVFIYIYIYERVYSIFYIIFNRFIHNHGKLSPTRIQFQVHLNSGGREEKRPMEHHKEIQKSLIPLVNKCSGCGWWRPSISIQGLKPETLNSKKFELDSVGEGEFTEVFQGSKVTRLIFFF